MAFLKAKYVLFAATGPKLARCCTRLQRLPVYMSAGSNCPGGDRRTLDFIVRRWLGDSGSGESASVSWLTVRRHLLTIASASHIKVLRDSSSCCLVLSQKRDESTFRTVRIWGSRTRPMWLADSMFVLKVIQAHCSLKRLDLTFSWSISFKASVSSCCAPMKFVP